MMNTREKYWNCEDPDCKTTHILEARIDCPVCGKRRYVDTKLYYYENGRIKYCYDTMFYERLPKEKSKKSKSKVKTTKDKSNKKSKFPLKWWMLSILFSLVLVSIIYYIITPKTVEATITNKSWKRTIYVEQERVLKESDWSLPYGAKLLRTKNEIKTSENGEDIYATKYYYKIKRWVDEREVNSSGDNDKPYWGDNYIGVHEREKCRKAEYWFRLNIDDKDDTMIAKITKDDYKKYKIGDKISVKVSLLGVEEIVE